MSTDRLKNYRLLLRLLKAEIHVAAGGAALDPIDASNADWDTVIEIADQEVLGPRLYHALRILGLIDKVPAATRAALKRRFTLNTLLNERIKRQAIEVISVLNGLDIHPIVIKGGLHLFEAEPDEIGSRVMGDLDMILSADQLDPAIDALRGSGFEPDIAEEDWTYHYRPLIRTGSVPMDMHQFVGEQKSILPQEEAAQAAIPIAMEGVQFCSLCPAHRIFHNVFHSQIQDRAHELRFVSLKQLLDLATIVTREGADIDWSELTSRIERGEMQQVWAARRYQLATLLGVALPPGPPPTISAKFHNWRCLMQVRWPGLAEKTLTWAAATQPFKQHSIDLIYDCGTNPIMVNLYRLRHAAHLTWKYRGNLRLKIAEKRSRYE